MKLRPIVSGIGILAMSATFFAGCQQAAPPTDKAPDEVIKEGLMNNVDVDAASYEVQLTGDIVEGGEPIKFDVMLSGAYDMTDLEAPKFSMALTGSGSADGGAGSATADAILSEAAAYFRLASLEVDGEEVPAEIAEFIGKWWMITLPEGTFTDTLGVEVDDEARASMKEALEEATFFTNPEFVGSENVMGESSFHYSVDFDKEKFAEFSRKAAEESGEAVGDAELEELMAELEGFELDVHIWVGAESNIANQVQASMTSNDPDSPGTVTFRAAIGNINETVSLDIPSDAEEFPIESLLGPMMMQPSMMDDSMMLDESMMLDDSMMDMTDAEFEAMMEEMDAMEAL